MVAAACSALLPRRRSMVRKLPIVALAGLTIVSLGALAGCSSGAEDGAEVDDPLEETRTAATTDDDAPAEEALADEETPAEDPADTGVTRHGVGDTFTAGDEFFGIFDLTYLGIADMGQLDDGGEAPITCFAVLVEASLQEMPADNEDPEVGSFTHEVLDANGDKAADNFSSECPDAILAENGFPSKFGIDWVPGTVTRVTIEKLTIPTESIGVADSVDIDPEGQFVLDFDIVESW